MEALKEQLKEILCREGAEKWGVADFSALLPYGFPRGVSVAVSLPRHMVEELKEGPTREYYYLYKELNARLDRIITAGAQAQREAAAAKTKTGTKTAARTTAKTGTKTGTKTAAKTTAKAPAKSKLPSAGEQEKARRAAMKKAQEQEKDEKDER